MSRVIVGLRWAKACSRPACIPKSRPRGKKAAGLKYERDLAKAIKGAIHGQWFEFEDKNGHGWCQPDLFFTQGGEIFVLESKYTWTQSGHDQINLLYRPVLEAAFNIPVSGIVVCKVLTPDVEAHWVKGTLEEAIEQAKQDRKTVLHWVGVGLEPFRSRSPMSHIAPPHPIL